MTDIYWKDQVLKPGKLFVVSESFSGPDNHMLFSPKEHKWMSFEQNDVLMFVGIRDDESVKLFCATHKIAYVVFLHKEALGIKLVGGHHNFPISLDIEPEFQNFIEKLDI